MTADPA